MYAVSSSFVSNGHVFHDITVTRGHDVTTACYRFAAVNGESLMEFKHLMFEDPQYFNKSAETEFGMTLKDVMTIRKALRNL